MSDLSPGVARLLGILARDDVEIDEVARELEFYPVVSARLLGLANSVWSSSVNPVSDLATACARLGLDVVRTSAIAYVVAAPFDTIRCRSFDPKRFWCCSLLTAEAAGYLAERQGVISSLARAGGMLRNLGLVWFADAVPEATNEALTQAANGDALELGSVLERTVGASHLRASHHLLSAWGLADELLDACDPESTAPLASICRLSSHTATAVYLGTESSPVGGEKVDDLKDHVEQSLEKLAAVAETIA